MCQQCVLLGRKLRHEKKIKFSPSDNNRLIGECTCLIFVETVFKLQFSAASTQNNDSIELGKSLTQVVSYTFSSDINLECSSTGKKMAPRKQSWIELVHQIQIQEMAWNPRAKNGFPLVTKSFPHEKSSCPAWKVVINHRFYNPKMGKLVETSYNRTEKRRYCTYTK